MVVVGLVVLVVHAERSVHVAQVVKVMQLGKRCVRQLSFATETLEQMASWHRTETWS